MSGEATRPDGHLRSPPGWSVVIDRISAFAFAPGASRSHIAATYRAIEMIILQELPASDERDRLLQRLGDLAVMLINIDEWGKGAR
jgi:hypothetical protein